MKIGNILRNSELVNHRETKYLNYLTISDDFNSDLPTLIVGWQYLKEYVKIKPEIQNNISILNKVIIPNKLYWEFSFNEDKQAHVNGIEEFTGNVCYYYFKQYEYNCLDPIFYEILLISDFINYLPYTIDNLYNYKNEMLYFRSDNDIFGVDLKAYKFYGLDIDEILNTLISKSKNYIIDVEGNLFQEQNKIFIGFRELKRYMVIIL